MYFNVMEKIEDKTNKTNKTNKNLKYCSPKNINKPTLFNKKTLILLINAWNASKEDKIEYNKSFTISKLTELLNNKIKPICNDKEYWCWPSAIKELSKDYKTKEIIKKIEENDLRPEMPIEWYKNPIEWLSNYDIEDVMIQYNNDNKYKYCFLGVFPIDFSEQDNFGRCLYSHICSIDINKYINKNIKYIGLITNLDKHNEPGSHWTSTFIILDPKIKCYGAYYYDSNAMNIPTYVVKFINNIKKQLNIKYPKNVFKIHKNNIKHQRKNTECGMFSMAYQIRWLNGLLKFKELHFKSPYEYPNFVEYIIKDNRIKDESMEESRTYLYRPNFKKYINDRNITL